MNISLSVISLSTPVPCARLQMGRWVRISWQMHAPVLTCRAEKGVSPMRARAHTHTHTQTHTYTHRCGRCTCCNGCKTGVWPRGISVCFNTHTHTERERERERERDAGCRSKHSLLCFNPRPSPSLCNISAYMYMI